MQSEQLYKKLAVAAPLITAALIFLAVIKLHVYYSYFDIDIVNFLDLSEVLTSFLDDVWFAIILGVVLITQSVVAFGLIDYSFNKGRERKVSSDAILRKLSLPKGKPRSFITTLVVCLAFYILFEFWPNKVLLYFVAFTLLQAMFSFGQLFSVYKEGKDLFDKIIMFIFFFMLPLLFARLEILTTMREPPFVKITSTNGQVQTSEYIKFIGKTQNYLFFRNDSTESSLIIPLSQVQRLDMRK